MVKLYSIRDGHKRAIAILKKMTKPQFVNYFVRAWYLYYGDMKPVDITIYNNEYRFKPEQMADYVWDILMNRKSDFSSWYSSLNLDNEKIIDIILETIAMYDDDDF